MQTDLWLTETSNSDICPLCSKPLKRGSQTCFACGFSSKAPSVWIDPTVHAYQHVMPQRPGDTHVPDPQAASPVWQYESPHFEAAGSLPMLSLFMSETPTQPQPPVARKATTRRLPEVDEIDTLPPQLSPARDIDKFDTLPPGHARAQRALVIAPQSLPADTASGSWTAGSATGSPSAQLISSPTKRTYPYPYRGRVGTPPLAPALTTRFNPLDRTRWWLLRPGRIEFILWLGGTFLLIGVTCLLLFVSALSFQWIMPFAPANPLATNANGNNARQHSVLPTGAGPFVQLYGASSLVPGQSFQLRGQGFKPASLLTFYIDGKPSLLDQSHQQAWTQVNKQGSFQETLWLSNGASWSNGAHLITVRDASGGQSTALPVSLNSSSNGTVAKSSSPVVGSTPNTSGGASNATSTPPIPQSTPVNRPPVTVTPTLPPATPSPTPTKATPTVTPTVATSPTVTPTVKTTPTPASSPASGTPTPGVSPTATASNTGLGNALNDSGVPPVAARLASISPWIWVMVACYLLSMLSLGAAGIIHKRHRKIAL